MHAMNVLNISIKQTLNAFFLGQKTDDMNIVDVHLAFPVLAHARRQQAR